MSPGRAWVNTHNHSVYSDGSFDLEQIAEEAHRGGLTHVAVTDHFETGKVRRCLTTEDLPEYLRRIRALNDRFDGETKILAGVEIDTNPERCALNELPFDLLNQLDLCLFEYVNDEWNGGSTLHDLAHVLSNIDVPCGLAHTDVELVFSGLSPNNVADLLASYNLFAEVNTAHLYKRDGVSYYERAERNYRAFRDKVKVSVGTDAHRTLSEVSNVRAGHAFLERIGSLDDLVFK